MDLLGLFLLSKRSFLQLFLSVFLSLSMNLVIFLLQNGLGLRLILSHSVSVQN